MPILEHRFIFGIKVHNSRIGLSESVNSILATQVKIDVQLIPLIGYRELGLKYQDLEYRGLRPRGFE